MDVSYKRSRGISCLVLLEDSQTAGQSYQKTIFLENSIPGLIPCKVQRLNGEEHFSYDITGCQSLENLFMKEKFSHKDLEKLLENWLRVCDALDEYLLDMDYLLLAPSYIYRNMHTGDYQFIWFPFQVARENMDLNFWLNICSLKSITAIKVQSPWATESTKRLQKTTSIPVQ